MTVRYRVQVLLQGPTGLPKDNFENVWHFSTGSSAPSNSDCVAIATQLGGFYNSAVGANTLGGYLSSAISEGVFVKFYDEDSVTKPRALFYTASFGMTTSGTTALPEQIALCLSYYSSANQPRHRGRIYLGPWGTSAVVESTAPDEEGRGARPAAGLLAVLQAGGLALVAAGAGAGPKWCVRSGGGTDSTKTGIVVYEPVTHGWIDNEWDSAHRRRVEASARVTF